MLSMSSGHSAGYLTGSVGGGRESYYTGAVTAGEPPGRWVGRGAAALGLEGEVDAEVIAALFDRFADPRDPLFADPETRTQAGVLGKAPKKFRTPEEVVAARVEAYPGTPLPEQVQQWRIEAERDTPQAVQFHDLTYSPVKSVTVLHTAFERAAAQAAAGGDHQAAAVWGAKVAAIDEAIAVANDAMIEHMAQEGGFARTGRHGAKNATGRWVDAHDLVVAAFYQHTSRDLDPQLHVHNAVLNRVECPDGEWRAPDARAFYWAKQGGGALADRILETELTRRLAVTWQMREDGIGREIVGIDQEAMDLFSSRSRTLTKKAEQLVTDAEQRFGRQLTSLERDRLRRQASMATRRAKTHDGESRAEQLDRWDAELRGELAGGLGRIAERFADTSSANAPTPREWSPAAVIAQAVEACHTGTAGDGRATFGRSELLRQVLLALPDHLGDLTPEEISGLAGQLTDKALEDPGQVVQTAGREYGSEPADSRLADGRAATIAPGSQRWAGTRHVHAEIALLRHAGIRGRHHLDSDALSAWLDGPGADLSPAQRQAVAGLATSDAALAVLVGPAGTGKSFTAGALAGAWADLSGGGRVVGVATAQVAADVLRDDGIPDAANIAAFLTAQSRLAAGRTVPGDDRWQLSARDVLLVDEASMLDTTALTGLQQAADTAGARVVLMGDPRQLGAVGAGGMMRTAVDHGAETHTLSEVRRFENDWERDASLRLRSGDVEVVAEYDRRGRVMDAGTEAGMIAAAARAAAADRISGLSTLVVAPTNSLAAQTSAAVRAHLVTAGLVQENGMVLGRDGCTAGVGDHVQARRIDRTLGLTSRATYQVTGLTEDGGLDVVDTRTGETRQVPAGYVEEDLTLAYAGTAHAAQGATVDTCHALLTPTTSPAGAYVGLSRGRRQNTAWAQTDSGIPDTPRATGRGVLAGITTGAEDERNWSATDIDAADHTRLRSAATLVGLLEDETRIGVRERLETDLDQFVAEGLLTESVRARFGSDPGTEHLARLLRAHEQAGTDPTDLLLDVVTARGLESALSVAQVVAGRIDAARQLPVPDADAAPPERLAPDRVRHLTDLTRLLDQRRGELGQQVAAEPPGWAVAALGAVPDNPDERAVWEQRAGTVAAWRETTGWESDQTPIGRCPGTATPEKRAQWHQAYAAAGMPEERRPEAEMTDGRLLVRAAAATRAEAAAPAHVDDQLRDTHQLADSAARDAVLARAAGNHTTADQLDQTAAVAAADARDLSASAAGRALWLAATLETREAGRAARDELERRGLDPDHQPDRTTASEWLQVEHQARREDDTHRVLTEDRFLDAEEVARDGHQARRQAHEPGAARRRLRCFRARPSPRCRRHRRRRLRCPSRGTARRPRDGGGGGAVLVLGPRRRSHRR